MLSHQALLNRCVCINVISRIALKCKISQQKIISWDLTIMICQEAVEYHVLVSPRCTLVAGFVVSGRDVKPWFVPFSRKSKAG